MCLRYHIIGFFAMATLLAGLSRPLRADPGDAVGSLPESLRDEAFDGRVDWPALASAWASKDSAKITDAVLAIGTAEAAVGRAHRSLPADSLACVAASLALAQRDQSSLERLSKRESPQPDAVVAGSIARFLRVLAIVDEGTPNQLTHGLSHEAAERYQHIPQEAVTACVAGQDRQVARLAWEVEWLEGLQASHRHVLRHALACARLGFPVGWRSANSIVDRLDQLVASEPTRRLLAQTRALAEPETLAPLPATGKRQVLIYYANETAPDAEEERNLQTLLTWMRSADQPTLTRMADTLEFTTRLMPLVVDWEITTLAGQLSAAEGAGCDLIVFTNRWAREKSFGYIRGGDRSLRRGTLDVPALEHPVYRSYPLAHEETFERALCAVVREFDPSNHEFVLIAKSHGGREHAITTPTAVRTSDLTREQFLQKLLEPRQREWTAFAAHARRLVNSSGKPVTDPQGNHLLTDGRRLLWENRGNATLRRDNNQWLCCDPTGQPFATSQGDRIALRGERLVLENSGEALSRADGQAAVLAGVVGQDFQLAPFNPQEPTAMPVTVFGQALSDARALIAAAGQSAPHQVPATDTPLQTPPTLSASAEAVALVLDRVQPALKTTFGELELYDPILDELKMGNPILDEVKMSNPILDEIKMTNPILSLEDGSTMGYTSISGSVVPEPLGIKKDRFLAILRAQGDKDVYLRLVFVEACKSQLTAAQIEPLRLAGGNTGRLWTSDLRGLGYRTLNYDAVLQRTATGQSLADAIDAALQIKYNEQHP